MVRRSTCTPERVVLSVMSLLLSAGSVSAQNGDGGAASGNIQGSAFNNGEQSAAQGPSTSSANLSVGATVAIAVIAGVVVILGGVTAYLFFMAKKRQWTIRETIRHSRKRVATGLRTLASPITPHRATFTPVKTKFSNKDTAGLRSPLSQDTLSSSKRNQDPDRSADALRGRDLEKGEGAQATIKSAASRSQSRDVKKSRRQDMKIQIPQKNGTPTESPQTPMWTRFLGRS